MVKTHRREAALAGGPERGRGLSYAGLIDGRVVKGGLRRHAFHLRSGQLGDGVLRAQVLATDGLGQQLLSGVAKLRIDGQPPGVRVKARGSGVTVRVHDAGSGLNSKATEVSFGDGDHAHGGSKLSHAYRRPGRYTIAVRARDMVGNATWRRFEVRVP